MIYTEAELQALIHTLYEADTDTPASTDEDYLIRRKYLNMGIAFWETWRGVKWKELYTTLDDVSTGATTTILTGATQANCPTSLVDTLGFVQVVDSSNNAVNYLEVKQHEWQMYIRGSSTAKVYCLTGKPGAYKINWYPTMSSEDNGKSIKYPYYKRATMITATTDTPEPSDHTFLIHYTLSWLYKEEDAGRSREQLDIAINLLNGMKLNNDMDKPYQDLSIYDKLGSGFGV